MVIVGVTALALSACAGTSGATEVRITATESASGQSFTSDVISFEVGQPYHFVVENRGVLAHEFMILEPIEPGAMDMEEMDAMAMYVVEEENLEPGATYEFDYTFGSDAAGMSLEFACYLPGHYEAGMHLPITVEA